MKKIFLALFTAAFFVSVAGFAQSEEEQTQSEPEQLEQPAEEVQTQPEMEPTEEAQAQPEEQPEETVTAMAEEEGMEINFDQLPDAVKTTFESSDYAMWDVKSVHEMSAEDGDEGTQYKVTVTDGTKEESVLFNEEGEEVEQY